ncbi:MAG TPA: hypothetical protein PLF32_00455 [Bacteroidales bacterium]|nr:hypothetical protein [Bacteroidales bacterium]HOR81110.1 hypothetical protein [Bacteroidales bacterium]HPJ90768.1 hypothetical protein [Bacteroidales bacterium]
MGILYEKIVFYNCMLFFLFQFSIRANSQVVESFNVNKFSKDSISQFIIQFWKNTHDINTDFEINNISDLSLKNIKKEDFSTSNVYSFYLPIDSSFYELCRDSNNVVRVLAHTSVEIQQIIVINNGFLYLIDMRNPLQLIVDNISSIPDFSDEFIDSIIKEIKRTHKYNWYLRHWDNSIIFEFILEDKIKPYDPNEW